MEKIINYENLRNFCYSNDRLIQGPIRGIMISFYGLGCTSMYWDDPEDAAMYAEKGIVYLFIYSNPWGWMNAQEVRLTDEILDVLFDHYGLSEDLPILSSGGSMGGLAALTYMAYAKRTPCACLANCPVCDLPYHYTERDDLPRTLYDAFHDEEGRIEDILKKRSPYHLIGKLPRVPYRIFHAQEDKAVNIHRHSETFVSAMKEAGYDISFTQIPGRGHCDLGEDGWKEWKKQAVAYLIP